MNVDAAAIIGVLLGIIFILFLSYLDRDLKEKDK